MFGFDCSVHLANVCSCRGCHCPAVTPAPWSLTMKAGNTPRESPARRSQPFNKASSAPDTTKEASSPFRKNEIHASVGTPPRKWWPGQALTCSTNASPEGFARQMASCPSDWLTAICDSGIPSDAACFKVRIKIMLLYVLNPRVCAVHSEVGRTAASPFCLMSTVMAHYLRMSDVPSTPVQGKE